MQDVSNISGSVLGHVRHTRGGVNYRVIRSNWSLSLCGYVIRMPSSNLAATASIPVRLAGGATHVVRIHIGHLCRLVADRLPQREGLGGATHVWMRDRGGIFKGRGKGMRLRQSHVGSGIAPHPANMPHW